MRILRSQEEEEEEDRQVMPSSRYVTVEAGAVLGPSGTSFTECRKAAGEYALWVFQVRRGLAQRLSKAPDIACFPGFCDFPL